MFKYLEDGRKYVLTQKGYDVSPERVRHERKVGEPVKGFETCVPESWILKGYVTEE